MHDLLFLISKGIGFKNLNDMWMEYWDTLSVPETAFNDRMVSWLGSLGYTGSYSDRYSQWVRDTPINQHDCFVDPDSGEFLANWSFNCGTYGWGFSPAYPATITDNGDGSLHLVTNSNYGSLVPNNQAFEDASWVLKCKVRNVSGTGKMSLRRPNNVWVNSDPYTADGEYSMTFTGAIKEIHVGAFNDAAYTADYDYISLRKVVADSVVHNGELVVHNNEDVVYAP
jgi:hypothetical protein